LTTYTFLDLLFFDKRKAGWIDVKWIAMENGARLALANMTTQALHTLNVTASQFATHSSTIAASGLPLAAGIGFIPGLMFGFKRG
jgi:hypothetical protein